MPPKTNEADQGQIALKVLACLMGIGIILLVLRAFDNDGFPSFCSSVGVSVLLSSASVLIGALVGFLFGIPRTSQAEPAVDPNESSKVVFRHNTNLEDISDWLTKILVGVGLTQLTRLPETLWQLANLLAPGISSESYGQVLVLATVVFYSTAGFLFSYLWTRLYFKGALAQADLRSIVQEEFASEKAADDRRDADALSMVQLQLNPQTDSPSPPIEELKRAIAEASSTVKQQILNQAWEVRRTTWQSDKGRMERTIPVFRALIAGDPADNHKYHGNLGWALKDQGNPNWQEAERELTKAIELRGSWEDKGWLFYEGNRAMCRIQLNTAKEEVLSDLRALAHAKEFRQFCEDDIIKSWFSNNNIRQESLLPDNQTN